MLANQDEKIDEVHTFYDDPKFIEVAVKSLPALINSVDYIFLLVLWDHWVYSENSEIIIGLETYSRLLFIKFVPI